MEKIFDLRSDTVTKPTDAMRDAMRNAQVGDDVMRDDQTVIELEEMAAKLFGKEAALFTASGTMSNQLALLSMTNRGDQVIIHDKSHMYNLERAGMAMLCGVQGRTLSTKEGKFDFEELKEHFIKDAIQSSPTTLLCLENTFDLNQGLVLDKDYIDKVSKLAHDNGLSVYLDGARVLNAAVALDIDPAELVEGVDALGLCMTKSLACPIGSVLVGSREMIEKARLMRQMIGGGWRQAGVIAAPCVGALKDWKSVSEDNRKAKVLAKKLKDLGLGIDMDQVQTNIIKIDVSPSGLNALEFAAKTDELGLKCKPIGDHHVRMICHIGINDDELDIVADRIKKIM